MSGVVTEHGRIATSTVLCAGGAWSSLFCARHGVVLPQLKVRSSVFRTAPAPVVTEHAVWSQEVAFRASPGRRLHGGARFGNRSADRPGHAALGPFLHVVVPRGTLAAAAPLDGRFLTELRTPRHWSLDGPSPFEATRVNDPAPNQRILGEAARNLASLFPALAPVPVVESWAGLIDVTPTPFRSSRRSTHCRGFTWQPVSAATGSVIGPAAGRLAAEMVSGAATSIDRAPFRLERFFN